MSFLVMIGTLPSLIASLGTTSHWFGFSEVRFISDLGKKFIDWLFENHINALPYLTLIFYWTLFSLLKRTFIPSYGPYNFFGRSDVILQSGKLLDLGNEVPEVS